MLKKIFLLITISASVIFANTVSNLKGNLSVNQGALNYQIPLKLPKGSAGFQPNISIGYNSNGSNGYLGLGWNIIAGQSSISRCGSNKALDGVKKGVKYNDEDNICLDRQRLVLTTGDNWADNSEYKTKIESYSKIVFNNSIFTVYSKSGEIKEYHKYSDIWLVKYVKDRFDNTITYEYNSNPDEPYLISISYANNQIVFNYEDKLDKFNGYRNGNAIGVTKRLSYVDIKSGDESLRTYDLSYLAQSSVYDKSMLESITECSGGDCLEPLVFKWSVGSNDIKFVKFNLENYSLGGNGDPARTRISDFNGDGFPDLLYIGGEAYPNQRNFVMLNDGTGHFKSFDLNDYSIGGNGDPARTRISDFNGDGFPDLLYIGGEAYPNQRNFVMLNDGTGHFKSFDLNDYSIGGNGDPARTRISDFNGDGFPDLLYIGGEAYPNQRNFVMLNDGTGHFESFDLNDYSLGGNGAPTRTRISDFNGDGFPDLLYIGGEAYPNQRNFVMLNDGTGHFKSFDLNDYSIGGNGDPARTRISDFNGDGFPDLLYIGGEAYPNQRNFVMLNDGTGHFKSFDLNDYSIGGNGDPARTRISDFNGDGFPDLLYIGGEAYPNQRNFVMLNDGTGHFESFDLNDYSLGGNGAPTRTRISDFNGDGFPDLLYIGGEAYPNQRNFAMLNDGLKSKKLIGVSDSFKNETKITYKRLNDKTDSIYTKYNDAVFPNKDILFSMEVVESVITKSTNDVELKTSYKYEGLKSNLYGLGSLGFAKITTTNHINDQKNITTYLQNYPFIGMLNDSKTYLGNELISESSKVYQEVSTTDGTISIQNITQETKSYKANQLLKTQNVQNSLFDSYGNVGQVVLTITDGITSEQFIKTISNTYENYTDKWLLGKLTNTNVVSTAYGDTKTNETRFIYDANMGVVLSKIRQPNEVNALTVSYVYDRFGNVINLTKKASDIKERTTTYRYGLLGKNQTSISNALGHTQTSTFNADGQVLSKTDPNGKTTTYQYDSFGKKIQENRPDGTSTTYEYKFDSSMGALFSVTVQSTGKQPKINYYNRLNQKILEIKVGFNGDIIYKDSYYDVFGRVVKESSPYSNEETPLFTKKEYDKYGRVIKVISPASDHRTKEDTYSYNGLTITKTNGLGQRKIVTKNVLGKTTYIQEEQGAYVNYSYDANESLIKTVDSKGITILLDYDAFGNKISQNDPDLGLFTYEYNALGKLVKQTDNKNQVTSIEYDILERMIKKVEPEGESRWVYDKSLNGVGKLSYHFKDNYKKEYQYDELGRVVEQKEYMDNLVFQTSFRYDELGRLVQTISPDGFVTINEYNEYGYLQAVKTPKTQNNDLALEDIEKIIEDNLANALSFTRQAVEFNNDAVKKQALATLYTTIATLQTDENITTQLTESAALAQQMADLLTISANDALDEANKATNQINYYLKQVSRLENKDFYNYLTKKFREQTKQFLTLAYENLDNAISQVDTMLNTTQSDEYLLQTQTLIDGYLDQTKDIVLLAQSLSYKTENYKIKYTDAINQEELKQSTTYFDLVQDEDYRYFYKVLKVDSFGRVIKDIVGNGLISIKNYDQASGQLKRITTGYNSSDDVRDISYTYDLLDNVTSINDGVQGIDSTYSFDNLNRLTNAQIIGDNLSKNLAYSYDSVGNILSKSDVGTYTYDMGTHRVLKAGDHNYTYDLNGNLIQKDSTTFEYTSYNKLAKLQTVDKTTEFFYDTNRKRYKRVVNGDDITYYSGKRFEKQVKGTQVFFKNFIYANGKLVAIQVDQDDGEIILPSTQYLHTDALGSVDTITNDTGVVLQRLSYQPFGKRIVGSWQTQQQGSDALTKRGYTGHEHIEGSEIIHMNGRVYDSNLARFTSADPFIQEVYNSQSFNRYSYTINNPLKYTDPSGYIFKKLKRIIKKNKKLSVTILTISAAYFSGGNPYITSGVRALSTGIIYGLPTSERMALLADALGGSFTTDTFLFSSEIKFSSAHAYVDSIKKSITNSFKKVFDIDGGKSGSYDWLTPGLAFELYNIEKFDDYYNDHEEKYK